MIGEKQPHENAGKIRRATLLYLAAGILVCLIVPYLTVTYKIPREGDPMMMTLVYASVYGLVITVLGLFWIAVLRAMRPYWSTPSLKKKISGHSKAVLASMFLIDIMAMYCLFSEITAVYQPEIAVYLKPAGIWGLAAAGIAVSLVVALKGYALAGALEENRDYA